MSLKTINNSFITPLIFFNASLVFFYISDAPLKLETFTNLSTLYPNEGILAVIIALLSFAINNILSSHIKSSIVYLKIHCPLPGCWAFSKLINQDYRLDAEKLKRQFPDSENLAPKKQNSLWYGEIYLPQQESDLVKKSHQQWLLYRDITSIMFLFICSIVALDCIYGFKEHFYSYTTLFASLFVLFWLAARNAGNQFVTNALAGYLNTKV